jgi:hypothetical protein
MKQAMAWIAGAFAALVVIYVMGFLATGGDLAIYRFWAPKQADAQREVFTHSQSYVQGKIQNIAQECHAYRTADPGTTKESFAAEIRDEATTVRLADLPQDEQQCVLAARGQ